VCAFFPEEKFGWVASAGKSIRQAQSLMDSLFGEGRFVQMCRKLFIPISLLCVGVLLLAIPVIADASTGIDKDIPPPATRSSIALADGNFATLADVAGDVGQELTTGALAACLHNEMADCAEMTIATMVTSDATHLKVAKKKVVVCGHPRNCAMSSMPPPTVIEVGTDDSAQGMLMLAIDEEALHRETWLALTSAAVEIPPPQGTKLFSQNLVCGVELSMIGRGAPGIVPSGCLWRTTTTEVLLFFSSPPLNVL